jgi:pimeloyl-ACP methyl ester carboxylesterase
MLLLALACSPPTPLSPLHEDGELGPFGVATSQFSATRATGRWFEVDVHLPTSDGERESDRPVVVFVQGGAVERQRYHWLAEELAAAGLVVLTPQFPNDLAILGSNRSHEALQRARHLDEEGDPVLSGLLGEPVALMGHSLGGVVSAKQWVRHPDDFQGLVLLASYPADGDPVDDRSLPVLSIGGEEDGSAEPADVAAGAERFEQAWLAFVLGMNHYDWTDGVTAEEREAEDSPSSLPVDQTRAAAVQVIEAYLRAALEGDPEARERLDAGDFEGVSTP